MSGYRWDVGGVLCSLSTVCSDQGQQGGERQSEKSALKYLHLKPSHSGASVIENSSHHTTVAKPDET